MELYYSSLIEPFKGALVQLLRLLYYMYLPTQHGSVD